MAAESSEVIRILMEMQGDLGEIRANSVAMKESLETHITDDKRVADRVTALEMRAEREKGFFKAWQVIVVLVGTVAGYAIQWVVAWFKAKSAT